MGRGLTRAQVNSEKWLGYLELFEVKREGERLEAGGRERFHVESVPGNA